jgi:hypothetical protein
VDYGDSAITQSDSFVGRHNAPGPLVKERPNGPELLRERRNNTHGKPSYHNSSAVDTFIYYRRLTSYTMGGVLHVLLVVALVMVVLNFFAGRKGA